MTLGIMHPHKAASALTSARCNCCPNTSHFLTPADSRPPLRNSHRNVSCGASSRCRAAFCAPLLGGEEEFPAGVTGSRERASRGQCKHTDTAPGGAGSRAGNGRSGSGSGRGALGAASGVTPAPAAPRPGSERQTHYSDFNL